MTDRERMDDELARRLEAYADARLSPSLSATSRMRAHVMAAAHRQAALARADDDRTRVLAAPLQLDRTRMDRTRQPAWRRPLTALLAAGLTLAVGVGSVAAAQPGGPLYGARVWAETLTLPANASERAQAELSRLQDRLAEAAAATSAGDLGAAQAALDAYSTIVDEATNDLGNDVAAAATLEKGVRSNIDVLAVLVNRAPNERAKEAIQAALQRAIELSDAAANKIHGKPSDTPGVGPEATKPPKSPKPTATDRDDRTANPNRPTAKPNEATNKPRPTPKAAATPRAEHSPRGGPPSERPDGQPDNPGSN